MTRQSSTPTRPSFPESEAVRSGEGSFLPDSQYDTVLPLTPRMRPSSSLDKPRRFRAALMGLLDAIDVLRVEGMAATFLDSVLNPK